ncbi:MAG: outer membrane beta-barrel protein [Holophaga sp.]|nr:outer membrane beta-barrel protein [Holophaga sp.]
MKKTLAILVMGTALSLSAQDIRLGVQGAVSVPSGDLNDNATMGLQLGGHARMDLRSGHGLMGRLDAVFYGQNNSITVNGLAVAVDYTYHVERRQQGLYVLAGLSEQTYHSDYPNFTRNDNGLGIDLGVGYDIDRHLGLQARYTTNSFSNLTYSALNLGVTYTF